MKSLFAVLALLSTPSFASHFIMCDVEAKVVKVENHARLNGVAIFRSNFPGNPGPVSDFDSTVTLEVTNVLTQGGHGGCLNVGTQEILTVKQSEIGTFTEGQTLKVAYKNVGDASGSRISFEVIQ